VIGSLETAKREPHAAALQAQDWDLLLIDEAHKLKNRRTRVHQFVSGIKKKYVLLLTATPVQNDLEELYNLITLLKPGQLSTYKRFRSQFVDPSDPRTPKNLPRFKNLMQDVMIRHRRTHVHIRMPKRTAQVCRLPMGADEEASYREVTELIRRCCREEWAVLTLTALQRALCSSPAAIVPILEKLSRNAKASEEVRHAFEAARKRASQLPLGVKVEATVEICRQAGDRILVYTDFLETQRVLAERLGAAGLKVHTFNGRLSAREKDRVVFDWRQGGGVLLSTECGSEGRNFQFCNVLINYDLPWNPMRVEQRIGRLHRLGQTRDVVVHNIVAAGTIEDRILELLMEKIRMFELVVGELDLILGQLESEKSFEERLRGIWWESPNDGDADEKMSKMAEEILAARGEFEKIKQAEMILSEAVGEADRPASPKTLSEVAPSAEEKAAVGVETLSYDPRVRDLVRSYFNEVGARVEALTEDLLYIHVPEEVSARFNGRKELLLAFRFEEMNRVDLLGRFPESLRPELVTHGSFYLDRVIEDCLARGRVGRRWVGFA
jgi:hypothetical protein